MYIVFTNQQQFYHFYTFMQRKVSLSLSIFNCNWVATR